MAVVGEIVSPSKLDHILNLTLRFSSFVGNRSLLNCRVKFSGPEGIFCGVWKVWLGLKVFRLCGNTATLLSGIILFYCVWRPLRESVQLEMPLPTLEGIGHAQILLPRSIFAFTELFTAWVCATVSWCFHCEVCGRKERGKSWTLRRNRGDFTAAPVGIRLSVHMYRGWTVIPKSLDL